MKSRFLLVLTLLLLRPQAEAYICDINEDNPGTNCPMGSLGATAFPNTGINLLRVMEVTAGGPAASAGMQVGDYVYGVNGEPLPKTGYVHEDAWKGAVTELAYAIERAESSPSRALAIQVLRSGVGIVTLNATLPPATAWRPSLPVGDPRMQAFYESVCAGIHTKVGAAGFYPPIDNIPISNHPYYYGPFYGMLLLASPNWNDTTGAKPYRLSINKIRTNAVTYLNSRPTFAVLPSDPGYVNTGFDTWQLTASAMFLAEYRRKSGDVSVDANLQQAAVMIANRIQHTANGVMMHGGVDPANGYGGGGLNIINAHAMLALGLLKGAGVNFNTAADAAGTTITQKLAACWVRLKNSTNLTAGANDEGNIAYLLTTQSASAPGCPGGWDSNARTPAAAAGYMLYLAAGGTPALADDSDKLNRMKAYSPRNWQRQQNCHAYSLGTVFCQMLLPFVSEREQRYFRENSRFLLTMTRDHTGKILYFPGRANVGGDGYMGYDNIGLLTPGFAWAIASGNLPSFPVAANASNRIFVRMNSPQNDWPQLAARRVKILGLAKNLDLDVTNYLGDVLPGGYTAAWSKVSGGGVTFTNPNGLDTGVTFFGVGNYRLRLVVSTAATSVTEDYDFEVATTTPPVDTSASLVRQPVSRICGLGDSAFFTVATSGNGPFVYEWKRDGVSQGISLSPTLTLPNVAPGQFGTYRCTITHPGGVLTSDPAQLCFAGSVVQQAGGLRLERWNGLGADVGTLTSSPRFPASPDVTTTLSRAEAPVEQGEEFGARLSGWLIPPTTGAYTFYVAADNGAELWLSTDSDRAHRVKIATVGVTGYRKYSAGASSTVTLTAGARYYFEALHVESGYDDFLSIAWRKPGDPVPADGAEPIPGSFFESIQTIPHTGYLGLLSHWRMDEGTGGLAIDSMASGNEGVVDGATWVAGRLGGGLHFDGLNDRVYVQKSAALGGLTAFSVAAWVKLDSPSTRGVIVQQRPSDGLAFDQSQFGQYQLSVTATGNVRFYCAGQRFEEFDVTGNTVISDGQWHHVAGLRDAKGDGRIYVDGQLDAFAGVGAGGVRPLDPESWVGIGADATNAIDFLKGSLDDVRIYNRALSPSELAVLALSQFTPGWTRQPWTGDVNAGISRDSSWAYHFGSAENATVESTTVTAVNAKSLSVAGRISVQGYNAILSDDSNTLTAQTGTGSAVIGKSFLYSANPATIALSNLTAGNNYVLTFLSCGWEAPGGRQVVFSSGGQTFNVDQDVYGENNGIRIDYAFTPVTTSRVITITPVVPNNAFHLYALALRDAGADSVRCGAPWRDDDSAGILPGSSWAYHFGSATSLAVNGQTVAGIAGANPSVAGRFAVTGVPSVFNGDTNHLTSLTGTGSATLAANFIYGGTPATVTLQGLVSGRKYVVTFLTAGWEAPGGRKIVFSSGSDRFAVDQDQFGDNAGHRIDYDFTADGTTRTVTISPSSSNPGATFHLYGLALRQGSVVTNPCDFGPNSLRQTLTEAGAITGADTITVDPQVDGSQITLGSELPVTGSGAITVDASSLTDALPLLGSGSNRLFQIASGATLNLRRVKLLGGRALGVFPASYGGAILSQGDANLTDCLITDCSASTAGGAIAQLNTGTTTLTRCALFDNHADYGGAIQNEGSVIALTSTFARNSATNVGGAISAPFGHSTLLKHCTLSGNTAGVSGGAYDGTGLLIESTIATGNSAPTGPNLNGTPQASTNNILTGSALLAPFGDYGGFSPTMPPLPGSPAINAGSTALLSEPIDQRGFARTGTPDIGAAEYRGAIDLFVFWPEDWDDDGVTNGVEMALGTDPGTPDPGSPRNLRITRLPNGRSTLTFGYNSALAAAARWVLKSSPDLVTWTEVFRWDGSAHPSGDTTGGLSGSTFTITTAQPGTKAFYRFEAELAP